MADDARQEAETPQRIFTALHKQYRFTIDICATDHNAKLPLFISKHEDALDNFVWTGRVWCNPPYVLIPAWLEHAREPELAVFLLPVRSDRLWWMKYKPLAETHYFVGEKPHRRLQFKPPVGVKYSSNPACHCLMCFGEGFTPGAERWRSGLTGELLEAAA